MEKIAHHPANPRFSQASFGSIHPIVKPLAILLSLIVHAVAGPSDPGETALRHLEKIRTREIDLTPGKDTALSPQTSDSKRKEIARRLDRMARDLGTDPLEVGSIKQDGDLAAVLVRKTGGFDPSRLQVFPVALIKRESRWSAAPLPASFENSGIGYGSTLRDRVRSLETWMLSQRAVDLEVLRDQSASKMRSRIEAVLPTQVLRAMDALTVSERFLSACENRNLPEVLGLLGGLSSVLPDDWPLRLKAAETAIAQTADALRPWRLLIAPEVLRVKVYHEEDGQGAMASIACLDPMGQPPEFRNPRVELIHLELNKSSDGLWRVDPPESFTQESSSEEEDEANLDADLLDLFPAKLSLKAPVAPAATATAARDALLATFANDSPLSWCPLLHAEGEPAKFRETCTIAIRTWWETRSKNIARKAIPLAFHETGDTAACTAQFFDPRNPEKLDLRVLYFHKTAMGWLWSPVPSAEITQPLETWVSEQEDAWADGWQPKLLLDSIEIEQIQADTAPAEAEAQKVVEAWLVAIRDRDVTKALALTARFKAADSADILLRNLGYELAGAQRATQPTTIGSSKKGSYWTGVSAKSQLEEKPHFHLYPVISTPAGPRILLEVDLVSTGSRSRDYLNKTALSRLRKLDPAAATELDKAFSQDQETRRNSQGG
jgi:hypothetical protein